MSIGKTPRWESELWSYLSKGDGEHCPLYNNCQIRLQGGWCLGDSKKYFDRINKFIDNDEFTSSGSESAKFDFIRCAKAGRIFELVGMLAKMYLTKAGVHRPPVPTELISLVDEHRPIEIRQLPLKAYHGAIWRLSDRWIIQLKSNDTPARQRFTAFHEAFHILAHCRATPVFKKIGTKEGAFNELLADHFAGSILMPKEWAKEKWAEVKDLDRMVEIFEIPKPIVWFGLKGMGLI